jgi:formylglycine-generating enzyme required for sulfatase activity
MKKLLAPVLMFSAVLGLDAATIDKVVVRQQWPWSTDVKVEYKISGVTSPVDIKVEAYNGSEKLDSSNLAPAMTGDLVGISEDGIGTIVIDPVKAFGSAKIALANFKVKLSTEDSVLYKIFDLRTVSTTSAPVPVVELTAADIRTGAYGTYEEDYSKIVPGSEVGNVFIWTGVTNEMYKTTHLVMRRVFAKGRSFTMGDSSLSTANAAEHKVSFTNDFYVAVFPVTECQHKIILSGGTDWTQDDKKPDLDLSQDGMMPKSNVQWRDLRGQVYTLDKGYYGWWPTPGVWTSAGFVADYTVSPHKVANHSGVVLYFLRYRTGWRTTAEFDLPTEAKWEYACRAGTATANYAGANDAATVDRIAWYSGNSGGAKHVVGLKAPNPWGIYDMQGNVWEWSLDIYGSITSSDAAVDPVGPESTNVFASRVRRGGGYKSSLTAMSVGYRTYSGIVNVGDTADHGYRVIFDEH